MVEPQPVTKSNNDFVSRIEQQSENVGFSALDILAFSKQVTVECIGVIRSPQASSVQKLWAVARIINNFMNREAFFYIDQLFCVCFCIYNVETTRVTKAFEFYSFGTLFLNCVLLWYFSYCRHLNGKDVITLRRSIQLVSHSFQLCIVGMLIWCHENKNHVYDDDNDKDDIVDGYDHQTIHRHPHLFTCTVPFIFANIVRIFWHFTLLFKSLVDEFAGNFLITRGVLVDVITLLVSPPMIAFCLITDICAVDIRSYLIKALSVTFEVNDITCKTPFYLSMKDSQHRNKIEPILFFLIFLSSDLVIYNEELEGMYNGCYYVLS
jgi:hypothetical protein